MWGAVSSISRLSGSGRFFRGDALTFREPAAGAARLMRGAVSSISRLSGSGRFFRGGALTFREPAAGAARLMGGRGRLDQPAQRERPVFSR
jgi:hypothetical protein